MTIRVTSPFRRYGMASWQSRSFFLYVLPRRSPTYNRVQGHRFIKRRKSKEKALERFPSHKTNLANKVCQACPHLPIKAIVSHHS